MILNGQHSVNCFRYGQIGMHFKINLVPDPSCKASRLDIFVDKSTQMVIFSPFLQCFVRIMCDYAQICKLCNQIEILINYAESHHRTLSEALSNPCPVNITIRSTSQEEKAW